MYLGDCACQCLYREWIVAAWSSSLEGEKCRICNKLSYIPLWCDFLSSVFFSYGKRIGFSHNLVISLPINEYMLSFCHCSRTSCEPSTAGWDERFGQALNPSCVEAHKFRSAGFCGRQAIQHKRIQNTEPRLIIIALISLPLVQKEQVQFNKNNV